MFFFNDECDFRDDDQYDFFTLATQVERRQPSVRVSFGGRTEKIPLGAAPGPPQRNPGCTPVELERDLRIRADILLEGSSD